MQLEYIVIRPKIGQMILDDIRSGNKLGKSYISVKFTGISSSY